MQAVRAGIRALRTSSSSPCTTWARSHTSSNVASSPVIFASGNGAGRGVSNLGFVVGARDFSQSTTAACSSPSTLLEKEDVALRVLDLLKSIPFIDPSKVEGYFRRKKSIIQHVPCACI